MSYKPILTKFCSIRNANLAQEGKDTVLLAKKDNKLYKVEEYVGLITKVHSEFTWLTSVPEIDIRFEGGKTFRVRAYLDKNVTELSFVSIYGIFTPKENGELEFTCKCGMVRAFDTLGQAGRINTNYLYRFGIVQLSRATASVRYPIDLKDVKVLEENNLWVYSSKNLEEIEKTFKEKIIEEDSNIDFSANKVIFINNSEEIEDISSLFKVNEEKENEFEKLPFISLSNYVPPIE